MENWKSVVGYEGLYEVSDLGRVRSLNYNHTGVAKILNPRKNRGGYLLVALFKDGKRNDMQVHRLVAQAFIPNPLNLDTVNHRDEGKTNNAASNLEWMSLADNLNYGSHNMRSAEARVNHPKMSKLVRQLDKQGNLLATFPSTHEAERVTRIHRQSICACCNGKNKSAGGYVWKYLGNISEE